MKSDSQSIATVNEELYKSYNQFTERDNKFSEATSHPDCYPNPMGQL